MRYAGKTASFTLALTALTALTTLPGLAPGSPARADAGAVPTATTPAAFPTRPGTTVHPAKPGPTAHPGTTVHPATPGTTAHPVKPGVTSHPTKPGTAGFPTRPGSTVTVGPTRPGTTPTKPGTAAKPATPPKGTGTPVTVARYTFDAGAGATGRIPDISGRGAPLTVRSADGGRITFPGTARDKDAAFPAACAKAAPRCPRALLEGADDPDLDPGTRRFQWGASVRLPRAAATSSANVIQKGVSQKGATASQWKLQIGARRGRAQCVVVGQAAGQSYLVASSVGVADDRWHTIGCRRMGSTLTVFVDGQDRGHRTIPATVSIANALPLRLGGPNLGASSDRYHGMLDDVYARLG